MPQMYELEFYEDDNGYSEVKAWIDELESRSRRGEKDSRIQLKQLYYVMERFQQDGMYAGESFVKRITKDIYELRPGDNRVMLFGWQGKRFVLLSCFRKKSRKTPPTEIEKAERLMKDWIQRKGKG
jgi:phage-related protein